MDLFNGKTISRAAAGLVAVPLAFAGATLASAGPAPSTPAAPTASTTAAEPYEILVVGKTLGFRHSHIDDTTRALIALGEENEIGRAHV